MDLPDTLPARLYLLTCRAGRDRFPFSPDLGLALRAAALADLLQRGLLRDDDGRAVRDAPAPARLDPLLAGVLDRISLSRPHRWEYWVRSGDRGMPRAVRLELDEQGFVDLEEHRLLGLIRTLRPVPSDPRVCERLGAAVTEALEGPLAEVAPWQAALVAVADAAQLHSVLDRDARRANRERIADLAALAGPVPPALRRAVRARRATAAGS